MVKLNTEIERKYRIEDELKYLMLPAHETSVIIQDYLDDYQGMLVRLSHVKYVGGELSDRYMLSLKSKNEGLTRTEIGCYITHEAYVGWLGLGDTKRVIKVRKKFMYEDKLWEVDFFTMPKNMMVAEIELSSEEEKFKLPVDLLGPMTEVTGVKKYYNYDMAV